MPKNIELSEKHGVNPTTPVCFFCGEEKNEVALLGKLPNDAEAPRSMVIDYEPCDACKERFKQGILLIGVTSSSPYNMPPIKENHYPTGQYAVVTRDFIKRNMDEDTVDNILETGAVLVPDAMLDELQ